MSTTQNIPDADAVRAHLAAMQPDQLAAALAAASPSPHASRRADGPRSVSLADEDRAIIVEALKCEVENIDGLFQLQDADGDLDPVAALNHLSRYVPLLQQARDGYLIASVEAAEAAEHFAADWRRVDGAEHDPRTMQRVAAFDRIATSIRQALVPTTVALSDESLTLARFLVAGRCVVDYSDYTDWPEVTRSVGEAAPWALLVESFATSSVALEVAVAVLPLVRRDRATLERELASAPRGERNEHVEADIAAADAYIAAVELVTGGPS